MQENFKNLLLENQSALIYFNTGIRKLRGTLSYVTFESVMWEIRFRRRRQNFGVVWWCQEDRKAGSNVVSCREGAADLTWACKGSFIPLLPHITAEALVWEASPFEQLVDGDVPTASFALLQLSHCVIATDKGIDSDTESENLISFQPQPPTPSLLLSAQLKECQRDGVKHTNSPALKGARLLLRLY